MRRVSAAVVGCLLAFTTACSEAGGHETTAHEQKKAAKPLESPSHGSAPKSEAQKCVEVVMREVMIEWRSALARPLSDEEMDARRTFLDKHGAANTPEYSIYIDHYKSGMDALTVAVAMQHQDPDQALVRTLADESWGIRSDCEAVYGQ